MPLKGNAADGLRSWSPVFGFLGGYIINAHIFLDREDSRFVPELTRQPGDPGKGHTAVVYFTHGEPETYDPIGWINQFREFDEQGIKFVPFVARPVFAYMLRNRYLEIGKSNHRQVHHEMLHSLEKTYRLEGDSAQHNSTYASWMTNPVPMQQ